MPLISIRPDSAELLISCCPRVSTSAILQEHIENEPNLQIKQLCKDPQKQEKYIEKG